MYGDQLDVVFTLTPIAEHIQCSAKIEANSALMVYNSEYHSLVSLFTALLAFVLHSTSHYLIMHI